MATVADNADRFAAPDTEQRERFFFLVMALAIAATVLAGFGSHVVLGISSFSAPWWVHVHAVSFMAWIALYVTQNLLVFRGSINQHRRLGRMGAGLALWMVIVGLVLTPVTMANGRIPFIFTPTFFLALDWVNIGCFAALVYAAVHLRNRTDWHRRLMLCATICLIAPASGRLLALADAMSVWTYICAPLVYITVAMVADWYIKERVHPAYFWGLSAIFAMAPIINALVVFPPFHDLAMRIAA